MDYTTESWISTPNHGLHHRLQSCLPNSPSAGNPDRDAAEFHCLEVGEIHLAQVDASHSLRHLSGSRALESQETPVIMDDQGAVLTLGLGKDWIKYVFIKMR